MVRDEDLDKEIHRTEVRLSYLRQRKRSGFPSGRKSKNPYVSRKKVKEDDLYVFFRSHIMNGAFKREYLDMYDDMIKHSRAFVSFHNQVFRAINTFGNGEHKKVLEDLMETVNKSANEK